ncbi:unnamed protein product, partial [Prorocentrum cordatum]
VSTRWYIRRLTNQQCEPRPKCVMDSSSGAGNGRSGGSDTDWDTLAGCLKKLWQEEGKKTPAEARKLSKGRGRQVGDWKVAKELCSGLDVPRASAHAKFVSLAKSCGPLADYLVQEDTDVNFFGKQQRYALLYPVMADVMLQLSRDFKIPAPAAPPSERWLMGARPGDADHFLSDDEQELRQIGSSVVCSVADVVDIAALIGRVESGADRPQVQVQGYARLFDNRGTASTEAAADGEQRPLKSLLRKYVKQGYGRLHTVGPSLQKITREARCAALAGIPGGVLELDIKVAFFSLLVVALKRHGQICVEAEFPLLCDIASNWGGWKSFVSGYFDVGVDVAKKLPISATSPYGRQSPDPAQQPDWLPHLDCVQTEASNACRFLLEHDALYQEVAKARPECSSLHIFLGELECRVMMSMKHILEEAGAVPISLVYDGTYFRPMGLDVHDEGFIGLVTAVEAEHGVSLHLKDLSGAVQLSDVICADPAHFFLLHIGAPGTRGHAVGLRAHGGSQQMLVFDSHQDFVMQIGDEALYDLVTHWDEGRRHARLLQVTEDGPVDGNAESDLLDLIAGSSRPCVKKPAGQGCLRRPAAAPSFPTPKKGRARAAARSLVGRTAKASAKSKAYRNTKYVRHGKPTTKSRGDRDKWSIDLESILEMPDDKLYRRCIRDNTLDNKAIERISIAVKKQREKFVKKREKTIVFGVGNDRDWRDAEADEAVFGWAAKADDPESVEWEQWAGIVERGRPESLVLAKTTAAPTVKRAPGPGAIRKVDWAPLANRYLKGRRIILHTDRAKSYAMRVEGVLHDSVRHCKKRVKNNGKWVWIKPCYARLATHKLPCGRKLRTKAGSQVIDSAWKYIRSTLGGQTMAPNSETAATAIRSAQWLYWHRGKDLWAEMGSTFCANF